MKLLKTIQRLVSEAEENYYKASLSSDNPKEIEEMEKKLDESLRLLEIYERVEKEKED
jgi:hypothetical protein